MIGKADCGLRFRKRGQYSCENCPTPFTAHDQLVAGLFTARNGARQPQPLDGCVDRFPWLAEAHSKIGAAAGSGELSTNSPRQSQEGDPSLRLPNWRQLPRLESLVANGSGRSVQGVDAMSDPIDQPEAPHRREMSRGRRHRSLDVARDIDREAWLGEIRQDGVADRLRPRRGEKRRLARMCHQLLHSAAIGNS